MNKNLTIVEIRIKFLRDLKGLTQTEVANKLNVSQALVNSWENGYQNISLKQLVKLAYFYQTPVDYILGLIPKIDNIKYHLKDNLDLKFLGKQIKKIRKIEGLNQTQFAQAIKTKRANISYYENGRITMSSADLKDICDTFGYSADWCLGNTSKYIRREKRIKIKESEYKTI